MKRSTLAAATVLAVGGLVAPAGAQGRDGLLRFKINPAQSRITAGVKEPMAMIRGSAVGTFRVVSGEVQGNPETVRDTGRVEVVIDAASYTTDSDARDRDVRENTVEAQRFPTIRFESTGLSTMEGDRDAARLGLRKKLTLHGVTREIDVPVAAKLAPRGRLLAEGTYVFKFEEYGVKRPSKMMGLMTTGDEAKIAFHIVADPV